MILGDFKSGVANQAGVLRVTSWRRSGRWYSVWCQKSPAKPSLWVSVRIWNNNFAIDYHQPLLIRDFKFGVGVGVEHPCFRQSVSNG